MLWITLSGIGDTILQLPALEILKRSFPKYDLVVLSRLQGSRELLEAQPFVDQVLQHDFVRPFAVLRLATQLRARRFAITVLGYPSNRPAYNGLSWLIGGTQRLSTRYAHRHHRSLGFLGSLQIQERERSDRFITQHNVDMLRGLGLHVPSGVLPRLTADPRRLARAREELTHHGLRSAPFALHAGCSTFKNHTQRRWPAEAFVALGRALAPDPIILLGGVAEEEARLNREIADAMGSHAHVVSTTNFLDALAILSLSRAFVGNDGSLFHAAAALRVPTVGIFGPTSPTQIAQPAPHVRVARLGLPCSPCFVHSPKPLGCDRAPEEAFACLRALPVTRVLECLRAIAPASA